MTKRIKIFSVVVLFSYAISAATAAAPVQTAPMADEGSSGISMRTAHKYLGFGALALGAVSALSSSSEDLHCASAWGACILGSAALTTGVIEYRRVFSLSDGIGRFDGHALLGGLATAGFVAAVLVAGSGGEDEGEDEDEVNMAHASIGGAALGAMAISIILIELKW